MFTKVHGSSEVFKSACQPPEPCNSDPLAVILQQPLKTNHICSVVLFNLDTTDRQEKTSRIMESLSLQPTISFSALFVSDDQCFDMVANKVIEANQSTDVHETTGQVMESILQRYTSQVDGDSAHVDGTIHTHCPSRNQSSALVLAFHLASGTKTMSSGPGKSRGSTKTQPQSGPGVLGVPRGSIAGLTCSQSADDNSLCLS